MRLRSALSSLFHPAGRRPARRRTHQLRCESLEGREVPAANLMGVNLSGVEDWSYDRLFADAMKSARRPSNLWSHEGIPPIDARGWPATDASIVAWHGIDNMNGTYRLSFTGQADVSAYWGSSAISNKQYNAATNTTTATLTYYATDGSGLLLNFANTRRTPNGATNTGVTDIKLMRPISPGSTTSYDPSVTFTQPIKDLVRKFSVVRMMDDTGSNGWDVNGNWDARRPADYASQAAAGAAKGMAWEYAVQFWNETDTDAWVNVPYTADDAYVTRLASLLKANLEAGRKVYVEFSNELWNTAGPYPGLANRDAAVAEVKANPNSSLNFDGAYPSRDPDGWLLAGRREARRVVEVSTIFRQVFGDDQMMSRVRPVLMGQLGFAPGWVGAGLDYMEDYYDSATYRAAPHPASYYLYGAGGSAYQDPDWSVGNGITVDQVFNTMPKGFAQALQSDLDWVAAFGLKRIAYEGGPSLDNLTANQGVPASTLDAAWADPRMRTELVANHNAWSANGGDLLMYFSSTGNYHWGMTRDPFTLDTQKLRAIDDLNAAQAAAPTYGKAGPVDLTPDDFHVPAWQGTIRDMRADSAANDWNGAVFRVTATANFSIRLTGSGGSGGRAEVFVDGRSIGTVDVPASGDTQVLSVGTLQPGVHGIVVRARAGAFGLSRVSVLAAAGNTSGDNNTVSQPPPTPATPATPTGLTANPAAGPAASLAWADRSTNETAFLIERATDPNFSTNRVGWTVGANSTTCTDTSVPGAGTYYYRVWAMNGGTVSGSSNTAGVSVGTTTGLAAVYFDNKDLTGPTATRTDAAVDFYWPAEPVGGMGADSFSARWTGQVQAVEGGTYYFRTYSDDGVRLWVNGKLLVNNWTDHAGTYNTGSAITLAAGGRYDVRLEYYDNTGGGVVRLEWLRPGQGGYTTVPTDRLTPSGGPALFADGFDTGLGQWTPVAGQWSTLNTGRGTVYAPATNGAERVTLAGDAGWTDYSLTTWVNLSSLSGGAGVMGRVVDSTHYYLLEVRRDASGRPAWFLTKRDGSSWTTLASGVISYTAGNWVRLRLTMSGTSLKAEASTDGVNFAALGTANDGRYAAGRIGLRAWNTAAYFDDVLVQKV